MQFILRCGLGGCILGLLLHAPALAFSLESSLLLCNEPLVVVAAIDEGEPWLELPSGFKYSVTWSRELLRSGQARWKTFLPTDAPFGPWIVRTTHKRWVFIRLPPSYAIVEFQTIPYARISVGFQELIADKDGRGAVVFDWLAAGMPRELAVLIVDRINPQYNRTLRVPTGPSQRTRVFVGLLSPILTSSTILPGHEVLLRVPIYAACGVTLSELRVNVPEGWECSLIHYNQEDHLTVFHFKVGVPLSARIGAHSIDLKFEYQCLEGVVFDKLELKVFVSRFLTPLEVIGHWDLQKNDVDLTQPFTITYERALFASSLLGKRIPYTTEIMTPELLSKILRLWAECSQR